MTVKRYLSIFHSKCIVSLGLAALLSAAAAAQPSLAAPSVDELTTKKQQLTEEIESTNDNLINTMAEIKLLEDSIKENEQSIEDAEYELITAEKSASQQQESMRLRMKYLYEHGSESFFTVLASSDSIADYLNRTNYVREVQRYDSDQISSYEATREGIQALRKDLETERSQLEVAKEDLKSTKKALDKKLKESEKELTKTDRRLADAKAKELAAEAERQRVIQNTTISTTEEVSNTPLPTNIVPDALYGDSTAADNTIVSGGSGEDVIAYAKQFVGNRYVWGGNSLTEGCDCSGFVVQIYKHFGVDLSAHRQSALLRSVGAPVAFNDLQPGDIVCYSGHVALYAGDGQIVEAQSSRTGITIGRPVAYKQILAMRRIFTN